jgi:hypothetical protein
VSNLPDGQTPLGKIARIENFADRAEALKRFAETWKGSPQQLDIELRRAGFVSSRYQNENGVRCQRYDWQSQGLIFPEVMLVGICGKEVFANAGQIAP